MSMAWFGQHPNAVLSPSAMTEPSPNRSPTSRNDGILISSPDSADPVSSIWPSTRIRQRCGKTLSELSKQMRMAPLRRLSIDIAGLLSLGRVAFDLQVAPVTGQPANVGSVRHRHEFVFRDYLSLDIGPTSGLGLHIDHTHVTSPCLFLGEAHSHG